MIVIQSKGLKVVLVTLMLLAFSAGMILSEVTYKDCSQKIMYRDYNGALKCVEELKIVRQSWYYPLYLEAKAYEGLGKIDDGLNSLKEAAELASGDKELFPIFWEYTFIYYTRWGGSSDQKNAEKWCVQTKSVASTEEFQYKAHSICGRIAYRQENFKDAERDLAKAWGLNKDDTDIAELYVKALQRLGKDSIAVRILEQQVQRKPSATLYGLLGEVYIKAKRYNEAGDITGKCLKMDPTNAKCRLILADALIGQKKWREAAVELQKLVIAKPKDWNANLKLGEVYLQQNDLKRAATYLKTSADNAPLNKCVPFDKLAITFEKIFLQDKKNINLDNAIVTINEGYKRCRTNGDIIETRTRLLERKKQIEEPTEIEIDCDKQPNHPECKKLEEQEKKKSGGR